MTSCMQLSFPLFPSGVEFLFQHYSTALALKLYNCLGFIQRTLPIGINLISLEIVPMKLIKVHLLGEVNACKHCKQTCLKSIKYFPAKKFTHFAGKRSSCWFFEVGKFLPLFVLELAPTEKTDRVANWPCKTMPVEKQKLYPEMSKTTHKRYFFSYSAILLCATIFHVLL